jgi:hypothetical protein
VSVGRSAQSTGQLQTSVSWRCVASPSSSRSGRSRETRAPIPLTQDKALNLEARVCDASDPAHCILSVHRPGRVGRIGRDVRCHLVVTGADHPAVACLPWAPAQTITGSWYFVSTRRRLPHSPAERDPAPNQSALPQVVPSEHPQRRGRDDRIRAKPTSSKSTIRSCAAARAARGARGPALRGCCSRVGFSRPRMG